MLDGVFCYESEADPEGESYDETKHGEPAGSIAVGDGACDWSEKGRYNNGEKDEAGASGVPVEDSLYEEWKNAIEGGCFSSLNHASPERCEQATGSEKREDWRVFADVSLGSLDRPFIICQISRLLFRRYLV